jgi:hypothetical protein
MSQDQSQPYDRALKSLFGNEAAEILPNLLPGSTYISEQNIEIDRTTLRADLVYNIQYRGEAHVLNMELQTDTDHDMAIRMLRYHVGLFDKHRLPVISMVIYPFETSLPKSPFRETSGEEDLLTFHYRMLPLWKLDALQFVRDRVVCMYTLLPAMKGANASLLLQAIEEMKLKYKESELGHHLKRFRTILRRSTTVAEQDKQEVEKALQTFDSLLESDPEFLERVDRERTEGEIRGLQKMALEAVEDTYPTLVLLAQERIYLVRKPEGLRQLVKLIYKAPDEATARWLLNTFAA